MNIIALYKTWDGGEFVDASLASIYDHVSAIVMVHSETSWLGEKGNTVKQLAVDWCHRFDWACKVHHVDVDTTSQEHQYQYGIDYIELHKMSFNVIMVVDADEIWEDKYIENAIKQIHDHPCAAYRSNMHTYLKTPFYRVDPPYGSPTVFLREPKHLTLSARGHLAPARQLDNVWMHHYTYVRESRALVERKLHQSCIADKSNEQVVYNWMTNVYDKLPDGNNLHGFERHKKLWNRVEKIMPCDFPPTMLDAKLMQLWLTLNRGDSLLDGEISALHRLCKGKQLAIDLGTYNGLSAVILSLACREVVTFDSYDPTGTFADTFEPNRYHKFEHTLEKNRELAARFGNITAHKAKSAEVDWLGGKVDVLFIDADHSESAVKADIEAWYPHLSKGSLVILHDNNDIHPGVQKAIAGLDSRFRPISCGEHSGSLFACEIT